MSVPFLAISPKWQANAYIEPGVYCYLDLGDEYMCMHLSPFLVFGWTVYNSTMKYIYRTLLYKLPYALDG